MVPISAEGDVLVLSLRGIVEVTQEGMEQSFVTSTG